eukprot:2194515-Prymnesium_polylepis.1
MPSRFRNILTNIILEYDGQTVFSELQVHHRAIKQYNEASHAHDDYEFFRGLYEGSEKDVDATLERAIVFLEEVKGVPVLLSMLVLLFKHRPAGSTEPLPADRFELYEMATRLAVEERVGGAANASDAGQCERVRALLARIAIDNTVNGQARREFTSVQVEAALMGGAGSSLLKEWSALLRSDTNVPLVKTLADAGGVKEGVYQFRHLSFQEGLFAIEAVRSDHRAAWLPDPPWKLLQTVTANAVLIGGRQLRAAICNKARVLQYTAAQLCDRGFSVAELRAGGYTAAELRAEGLTLARLRAEGYTAAELRAGGWSVVELRAEGFTLAELKAEGVIAAELRARGFTLAELRAVGTTTAEITAEGFTAAELSAAGRFTAAELRGGRFTAAELRAVGFTLSELRAGRFTAAELRAVGFTPVALRAEGFTLAELKTAGQELMAAGESHRSTLTGDTDKVDALALSADGRTLFSCSGSTPRMWAVEGEGALCVATLTGHTSY